MESQLMKSFWRGVGNAMKKAGEARARRALAPYQHILDYHGFSINDSNKNKKGA